ncbi:unnamed protein product, partial [Gadus morhua 'NCC']
RQLGLASFNMSLIHTWTTGRCQLSPLDSTPGERWIQGDPRPTTLQWTTSNKRWH